MSSAGNPGTWDDPNHSYRCWGNDGTTSTIPLNNDQQHGGADDRVGADRRGAAGGGHLPVYLDMQIPAKVRRTDGTWISARSRRTRRRKPDQVANGPSVALLAEPRRHLARHRQSGLFARRVCGFTAPGGNFTDAAGGTSNSHTLIDEHIDDGAEVGDADDHDERSGQADGGHQPERHRGRGPRLRRER